MWIVMFKKTPSNVITLLARNISNIHRDSWMSGSERSPRARPSPCLQELFSSASSWNDDISIFTDFCGKYRHTGRLTRHVMSFVTCETHLPISKWWRSPRGSPQYKRPILVQNIIYRDLPVCVLTHELPCRRQKCLNSAQIEQDVFQSKHSGEYGMPFRARLCNKLS